MTDKKLRKQLIAIHAELYSIKQAIALLVASQTKTSFEQAVKRMSDDVETYSTMLLNDLESRDLLGNDE